MNGPLKMYRTRQVVRHDFKVQLPDCMYKLKNIHAARNDCFINQLTALKPLKCFLLTIIPLKFTCMTPQLSIFVNNCQKYKENEGGYYLNTLTELLHMPSLINAYFEEIQLNFTYLSYPMQNNQNIPEMAALEVRQEDILQQLADLKKQMDSIRDNLKVPKTTPIPTIIAAPKQRSPPSLPDIVINASPTNPPYSLELIQKLWRNYIFFSVQTYTHSSLSSLNENAAQLTKTLENFTSEMNVPKVNVRLIWKKVGANSELIISHRPILGEVNILRYLSRVSSDLLNYETYSNAHEIDALLDVSYNIVKAKTKTERASLLQALNKSLGKSQFLGGRNEISIADLAAYSAIKQATNSSEVNVNLGKWFQRCVAY